LSIQDTKLIVFCLAFFILMPLSLVKSMKNIAYISFAALISIFITLGYLLGDNLYLIYSASTEDLKFTELNFGGLPFCFGVVNFLFEGNCVALELYN